MFSSHLQELTRYNYWAHERTAGWILNAGDIIADQPLVSSFPTIRKTFYHMWDAQVIWFHRLNGQSMNAWPSQTFTGNLKEATEMLLKSCDDFVRFAKENDEKSLEKTIAYHAIDGTEYKSRISEIILHVCNHGTYHRGQIITMLRNAGVGDIGSTDLIRYYRTS